MRRTTERLFDHLVGARKYGRGNVEARRFNQVIREQFPLTDGTHDVLSELLDAA